MQTRAAYNVINSALHSVGGEVLSLPEHSVLDIVCRSTHVHVNTVFHSAGQYAFSVCTKLLENSTQ